MRRYVPQVVQTFLLAAGYPGHGGRHLHRKTQAPNDVEMDPDKVLGIHEVGIELQHAFMIVTRCHGAAQRTDPGVLTHAHVGRA